MERVSPVAPQTSGAEVPSLASVEPLALQPPLEQLARSARTVPGEGGRAANRQLHAALETLQPLDANGELLLRLLDEHAFDGLRADDGTETRRLAVEALLRLGYPWALRIHPDELSWFREAQRAAMRLKYMILLGVLGAVGALGAAGWYLLSLRF
ncbi:MAG: hypothetical protein ACOZQL_01530 [Myxococcota bacterium]